MARNEIGKAPTTNRPTKIMYLMDRYIDPHGGTEGQVLQLIQFLDRSRFEPAITILRDSEYIRNHGFDCSVRVLGITRLRSMRSIATIAKFGLSLRRQHYRLVHCFFNDVSIISPPILRMFGIRILVSRRDMGFWYTASKLLALRLVGPFVDRFVANSQAVKRVVMEREHIPEEKVSVIYNGFLELIDKHERAVAAENQLISLGDNPMVGIVANLRAIKRLDILIQSFAAVCQVFPTARLVIIGSDLRLKEGSMRERLEQQAASLGILEHIVFAGSVADPMPYIRRFNVAVLCSESEGFSNAIIAYMQAGRPVVCTDTGGNPELVQDGYNGFLVPVGDSTALADRIVRLLSDSHLARRMGDAAYQTVNSTYTHERMVSEQMACYDRVLLGRR